MNNETFFAPMDAIGEAVDAHVEANHDAVVLVSSDPAIPGTSPFCVVYATARPVLLFVKGMLFFKPKWKTVLSVLIAGLDKFCEPAQAADAQPVSEPAAATIEKDSSPQ